MKSEEWRVKSEESADAGKEWNIKDYEKEEYKCKGRKNDEKDGEVAVLRSILHSSLFTLHSHSFGSGYGDGDQSRGHSGL